MLKLIINGSRSFHNYYQMKTILKKYLIEHKVNPAQIEVISGGAKGADQLAIELANEYQLQLKVMNADWDTYGKRAGLIRNQAMLDYATLNPLDTVVLLSFWDGQSRGTKHMIDICKTKGIQVNINLFHE